LNSLGLSSINSKIFLY